VLAGCFVSSESVLVCPDRLIASPPTVIIVVVVVVVVIALAAAVVGGVLYNKSRKSRGISTKYEPHENEVSYPNPSFAPEVDGEPIKPAAPIPNTRAWADGSGDSACTEA
jgi:hypothetical protein